MGWFLLFVWSCALHRKWILAMEMTSLFWVFDFSFILAMRLGDGGRVPKARLGIFEFYSEFCSLFGVFGMNFF